MKNRLLFVGLLLSAICVKAEEAPLVEDEIPQQAAEVNEQDAVDISTPTGPTGTVKVAAFTLNVENRVPLDDLSTVSNAENKVLFFTDLRGFKDQIIRHVWYYKDKEMANVEYSVRGPRWRVWSSKTLLPQWLGQWQVKVIDPNGFVVHEQGFEYVAVSEMSEQTVISETETTPPESE